MPGHPSAAYVALVSGGMATRMLRVAGPQFLPNRQDVCARDLPLVNPA